MLDVIEEVATCISGVQKVEKTEGVGLALPLAKLVRCRRDCKRAVVVEWAAREIQACSATSPDDIKAFACELEERMKEKGVHAKGSTCVLNIPHMFTCPFAMV